MQCLHSHHSQEVEQLLIRNRLICIWMFLVLFLLHIYLPEYIELRKKKKKKTLHINLKYYEKTCTGQSEKNVWLTVAS